MKQRRLGCVKSKLQFFQCSDSQLLGCFYPCWDQFKICLPPFIAELKSKKIWPSWKVDVGVWKLHTKVCISCTLNSQASAQVGRTDGGFCAEDDWRERNCFEGGVAGKATLN